MAEGGDNIFVYLGGEQEVPRNVTHVIIDRSVKIIPEDASLRRANLVSVETHDGLEKIEFAAFDSCTSLRGIKLPGVMEIGEYAFYKCTSLRGIKLPGVRKIEDWAFWGCSTMTDVEFGDKLETVGAYAFGRCPLLRRIAIPLNDKILEGCSQFDVCTNLTTVDLVGVQRIHNTIASLLLERWRDEMNQEIDRINQVLPNNHHRETFEEIQQWIRSVINSIEHYKAEHYALLKEAMTQLELAVWKAKFDEKEEESWMTVRAKNAKIDVDIMRKRITCGSDIIISNVLPFLQLAI